MGTAGAMRAGAGGGGRQEGLSQRGSTAADAGHDAWCRLRRRKGQADSVEKGPSGKEEGETKEAVSAVDAGQVGGWFPSPALPVLLLLPPALGKQGFPAHPHRMESSSLWSQGPALLPSRPRVGLAPGKAVQDGMQVADEERTPPMFVSLFKCKRLSCLSRRVDTKTLFPKGRCMLRPRSHP